MTPGRLWAVWSIIAFACDGIVSALLIRAGYSVGPILTVGIAAAAVYAYVVYKRYRVEVVPATDLKMFDDVEDLRILCKIYALDATGGELRLRKRLESFAQANRGRVFVWIVPRWGSWAMAMDARRLASSDLATTLLSDKRRRSGLNTRPLIARDGAEKGRLKVCPICDERAPLIGMICRNCGADLSLYVALSGSRIGRRLVDEKATAVRRKLRYKVPAIREGK